MEDIKVKPNGPAQKGVKKAREGRSPAFPFIDLGKALERAEVFRLAEGKHLVPVASAKKAWKLGEGTGAGRRTVAALGHFGLFENAEAGDARKVRLADLALNILLDKRPESPERDELIQKAALTPPIHKELWDKWQGELPSDATMETYLVRDRGFSSSGAQHLIGEYKATLEVAKLRQTGIMSPTSETKDNPKTYHEPQPAKVGDYIQWTSDGVDQLNPPAKVIGASSDGKWLWIAESETGIPMKEVQVVQAPAGTDSPETPPPMPPGLVATLGATRKPNASMKEEKNSLDEGEAILTWPENLSPDSVRDLEYWLKGVLQKAKRRAGVKDG